MSTPASSSYSFDCNIAGNFTGNQTTVTSLTSNSLVSGPTKTWSGDDSINKLSGGTGGALGLYQPTNTTTSSTYVRFMNGTNVIGSISSSTNGTSISLSTTSDQRLKSNIHDTSAQDAGQLLDSLRVRDFTWNNDPTETQHTGFIAQELKEVLPTAVSVQGGENGIHLVNTSLLIPYLVRTVQELREEVRMLKDQ